MNMILINNVLEKKILDIWMHKKKNININGLNTYNWLTLYMKEKYTNMQ